MGAESFTRKLLQISKTKIINVSAAIINIFVLLICSFFVLSIKMECDFPEQKGKYIFYSQGGMTHRNIRKSIMKESFWTGGIPIIFGVVISTIFMGTEVYLKKLSLEWIKQYAVKLMGTITGIIFLFLFIIIGMHPNYSIYNIKIQVFLSNSIVNFYYSFI